MNLGNLSMEAKYEFMNWLVKKGKAMWSNEEKTNCLLLWKTV